MNQTRTGHEREVMRILLACSAGMSTSLLEKAVNDYLKEAKIEGHALALSSDQAREKLADFDVVLLGPQIRFMLDQFQRMAPDKPVAVIEPMVYATANGEALVNQVRTLLTK
ncbi:MULTISPECIES: PTS sugar transporter subunit IIB [unclassified Mycoplasma]|uniref:PTS sugar transporter subunit IIB n=1 Tax=unclassified Mycoplasma TaxID=2683645 RepID=UPI000FDE6F0A